MLKIHNPATLAPPASRYSHAVEIPAGARLLFVAGQVGVRVDGTVAEGFEAQCEQAWQNLRQALRAGGMDFADLVRVNYYLLDRADVATSRAVRDRFIAGTPPASTLCIVKSLASAAWLFEIEAVAAKA
ncbi:MAG TPA: RidA family protein [Alphaproteobacteria bacterium]|nr:RidA family protein [Alphaproteobacteria bacterium]